MKSLLTVNESSHRRRTIFGSLLKKVAFFLVASLLICTVLETGLNHLLPLDGFKSEMEETINQTVLSKPGAPSGLKLKLGTLALKLSWAHGACAQVNKINLYETDLYQQPDFLDKYPGLFIPRATICIRALPFLFNNQEKQVALLDLDRPSITVTPGFLNKLKKIELSHPPDRQKDLLFEDTTVLLHTAKVRLQASLLDAKGDSISSKSWLKLTFPLLSLKHLNSSKKTELKIDQMSLATIRQVLPREIDLSKTLAEKNSEKNLTEETVINTVNIRLKTDLKWLKPGASVATITDHLIEHFSPDSFLLEAHKINTEPLLSLYQPFMKAYAKNITLKTLPRIERVFFKKTGHSPFYFNARGAHPLLKQWEIESEPSNQSAVYQLRFKADGIKATLRIGRKDQSNFLALKMDIPNIHGLLERLKTADIQGVDTSSVSLLAKYLASGSLKSELHWNLTPVSKNERGRWPTGTIALEKVSMPKIHLLESGITVLLGTDRISSKFTGQLDRQPLTIEAALPVKKMTGIDLLIDSGPLNLTRLNPALEDLPYHLHHLNNLHNLQGEIRAEHLCVHLPLPVDSLPFDMMNKNISGLKISGNLLFHQVQARSGFSQQSLPTPTINGAMAFSSDTISLKQLELSVPADQNLSHQSHSRPQTLQLNGRIAFKNGDSKNDIQIRTAPGADFNLTALNPFIQQALDSGVLGSAFFNNLAPPQSIKLSGLAQMNARLQGQWKHPLVFGTVKLKEGSVNAAFQANKGSPSHTFLVHHTNGLLTFKNKILLLQPLTLTWNQIQWKLSGKLSPTQSDLWMQANIPDVDPLYQPFSVTKPYLIFDTPISVRHIRAKAQSKIHWVQQNRNNVIDGSLNLQAVHVDLGPNHPPIEFNQLLIALKPGPEIRSAVAIDITPTQGKWGGLPLNLSSCYQSHSGQSTQQSSICLGPIDAGLFLKELKSHHTNWSPTLANHSIQGQFTVVLNPIQTQSNSTELILQQLQWDSQGQHISNLSGNITATLGHSAEWLIESHNLRFDYNQRLAVQAPFSLKIPSNQTGSGLLHLGVSDIENPSPENLLANSPLLCELPWEFTQTRFSIHNGECQLRIAQNIFPLSLQGSINNIQQPLSSGDHGYQWELTSKETRPQLTLKIAAQNSDGLPENLTVNGYTTWQDLNIPFFSISKTSGKAVFTGTEGTFSVSEFRIPGLDTQFSGKIDDLTHYPFRLSEVALQGKRMVVPLFQKYMTQVILDKFQKNWLEKLFGPLKPEDPVVPYEFQSAPVSFDSVVYDDVLLSQYFGKLSIYPSSYFELNDVRFKAAGGEVNGALSMDPLKNNHLSLSLNLHKVKVNPLAKTLLNAPNVIFGDMDGKIQVSSRGKTDDEFVKNADGTVEFEIENGRLPAVAKIETILTAANLVRGGIAGLSLNNLFRALSPFDTNYFAKLSGDFHMLSGVGHTDNLLSKGNDLSLAINGRVNMLDAAADLRVIGAMSQNVNGILGHFGKANLTSALHWIPILGTLPNGKEGLIYHIPGLGYIPGLGGIPKDVHRFQVNILGPINQLRSIKDFRWLTE